MARAPDKRIEQAKGMYLNGDKAELYFDAYKKFQNICFKM